MAARCRVCGEEHLLTRDGTMSVHNRADGTRCSGSVGLTKSAPKTPRDRPSPGSRRTENVTRRNVRLDRNTPPYAKQKVTCPDCRFTVPVTIYGQVAPYRVHDPEAVGKKARIKARRGCSGSGKSIPLERLTFTPADRPAPAAPTPEPSEPVKVSCHSCFVVTTRVGSGKYAAHQRPTGGWCPAGRPPTAEERAKGKPRAKGRGSVWAASAGLPGLGRGR